jgi:hypothetical protein
VAAGGAGAGGGSDALDQQLAADVQNLNAFSAKQLEAFVGLAVSFLTQAGGSDAHEQLAAFTAEHRVNRKAVDSCLRALLYFFAAALKESRSQAQVRQDLAKLGMDEERAALVASVFEKNMASMSASLIGRTLSVNELVDMEWKFGGERLCAAPRRARAATRAALMRRRSDGRLRRAEQGGHVLPAAAAGA